MITPRFNLDQTETQLKITIHAPYTNIKDTEIHVFEEDFRFYAAPYYLRLNLPGKVVENDNSSADYVVESNYFVICLDKINPGEYFNDLELITKFLQPAKKAIVATPTKPTIEIISGINEETDEKMEDDDWFIEQNIESDNINSPTELLLNKYKYGFANNHSGLETKYEVELKEVAEITNPDSLTPENRKIQRKEQEREKFSDDHYLADLMELDEVNRVLSFKFKIANFEKFSLKEEEVLKNLKNHEYLIDKNWQRRLYLGLVDIIFAYCYDYRVTKGRHCVESSWNISRLSATLSWFEVFDNIKFVVATSMCRSLCYPIYRNWDLSHKVFEDTLSIFRSGKNAIVKCLLDVQINFNKKSPFYLLNQLYIDEYIPWVMSANDSNIASLTLSIEKELLEITKNDVELDLEELEMAAKSVQEEEDMEEEMSTQIANVQIKN